MKLCEENGNLQKTMVTILERGNSVIVFLFVQIDHSMFNGSAEKSNAI